MYQHPDHQFHHAITTTAQQPTDGDHQLPALSDGIEPSLADWLESIGVPFLPNDEMHQSQPAAPFMEEQQLPALVYPAPMLMPLSEVEPDVFRTKVAAAALARKRSKLSSASRSPAADFEPSVDGVQALMVDITARFRHAAAVLSSMPNTSETVAAKFALVLGAAEFSQDPQTLLQAYTEALPHVQSVSPAILNKFHIEEGYPSHQCQVPLCIEDAGMHVYDERAPATFYTPFSPVRSLVTDVEEVSVMEVDMPRASSPTPPPRPVKRHSAPPPAVARLVRPVARRAAPVAARRPLHEAFPLEEDADTVDMPTRNEQRCALTEDLPNELWAMILPFLGRAAIVSLARTSRTMRDLMISLCDYKRTTVRIVPQRHPLGDYDSLIMTGLADWYPRAEAIEVILPTGMYVSEFWRPIRNLIHAMLGRNPNLTVIISGSVLKGTDQPGLPQPATGIKRLVVNNEHATDAAAMSNYGCIASLVNLDALECLALRGRIPVGRPTQHHAHIRSLGDHPLSNLKHVFILSDEAAVGPGVYQRPARDSGAVASWSGVRNAPSAFHTYRRMSQTLRNSDVMVHLPEWDRKWALAEYQNLHEPLLRMVVAETNVTENSRFVVSDYDLALYFVNYSFMSTQRCQTSRTQRVLFPEECRPVGIESSGTVINPFTGKTLTTAKWAHLLSEKPKK